MSEMSEMRCDARGACWHTDSETNTVVHAHLLITIEPIPEICQRMQLRQLQLRREGS
jgi:hypothetical protein